MLDRDEIKNRLKGVEPHLCVAFAARCSLRVLPLLVADKTKEAFWYWEKGDQANHVLAVLTANQIAINFSAFGRKINITAAANSVRESNINLETVILQDLDFITTKNTSFKKKITSKFAPLSDFIYSPLWPENPPEGWEILYSRFNQSLIDLNSGFEVWVDWYQDRINAVPLDKEQEEKWLNISAEIKEQGAKATNDYLASLISSQQGGKLQPLNLVRAIIIGNGAAGKTSLIRKIHDEPVIEGKEEMTPGIEIREWPVPETKIKARLWDFGGQVMSHSTHQFFLRERCLYILVLDARTEFNANDQAEYWLEHVKAFGNGASAMLVGINPT